MAAAEASRRASPGGRRQPSAGEVVDVVVLADDEALPSRAGAAVDLAVDLQDHRPPSSGSSAYAFGRSITRARRRLGGGGTSPRSRPRRGTRRRRSSPRPRTPARARGRSRRDDRLAHPARGARRKRASARCTGARLVVSLEEGVQLVVERPDAVPSSRRTAPRWASSAAVLRRAVECSRRGAPARAASSRRMRPSIPFAPRAEDRHEPAGEQGADDVCEVVVGRRTSAPARARLLPQDRGVQALQLGPGSMPSSRRAPRRSW